MNETVLYQISASTGKGMVWKINVKNEGTWSEIVIRSGAFDLATQTEGKLITNTAIVSEGKNLGKSNETTHNEQAHSEAKAKIELKLREGYVDDPSKVTSSAVLGSGIPKPMLAQKYHPTGAQNSSKTLKQMKLEGKKIIVEPKLDGNRCMIKILNGQASMYTRKGDLMPVQLGHITSEVLDSFQQLNFDEEQYSELIVDGELYCDPTVMSFNVLNGLIKRQKATPEQEKQRELIKFHIYDVMLDVGYEERIKIVEKFASDSVQVIEYKEIVATDANIKVELERWLEQGYEGLMIRVLGIGYDNKRSWQLVKVKLFEDREFKLIGFEEDVRGGFVGTFILDLPRKLLIELGKPLVDRDGKPIVDFKAGTSGQTVEDREYMLKHPAEFLGKMATVEYFGWDYRPRFGKFKGVRND